MTDSPQGIVDRAAQEHDPRLSFALFSGGHDSLVMTHLVMERGLADAVVHVNTGIGIPQTRRFVRDCAVEFGWPLLEYQARENTKADGTPDPQRYEELVLGWGFPGPGHHGKMYARLKERQIARLMRDFRQHRGQRQLLLTGLRRQESDRRMAYDDPIDRRGSQVWVNPCFHWSDEECAEYMQRNDLPRNPVKEKLCMSGECLCGAFAKAGELAEIALVAPEVADYLRDLESRVKENGFPWGWEESPPKWWGDYKNGQGFLPDTKPEGVDQPLCTDCVARHKASEDVDLVELVEGLATDQVS